MSFNHTSSRVAIGLSAILLASTALGQGPEGMQLGAPADCSTFGGAIAPNEGYFFQYDLMYWSIQAPQTVPVGAPGLTRAVSYGPHPINDLDPFSDVRIETNTLSTADITDRFRVGNRIEFGHIEDRNGWFMSIYQLRNQGDAFLYPQADIVFKDPPQGPRDSRLLQGPVPLFPFLYPSDPTVVVRDLPVTLYNIGLIDEVNTWGVEASYLHRLQTCHGGGTLEFFGGARYLEFNDLFAIEVGSPATQPQIPSFLAGSHWATSANNHVIGPQLGVRWFKKQGRWMFSSEGRFMAGLNCQNVHQESNIGPNLNSGGLESNGGSTGSKPNPYTPSVMAPTSATADAFAHVFTPLVELRVEGRYQITRYLSFHAGWTGFWMDNIARANGLINYQVPAMGIDMSNNKQGLLINGLTIGFDVNR
jgi:hypothetical protein